MYANFGLSFGPECRAHRTGAAQRSCRSGRTWYSLLLELRTRFSPTWPRVFCMSSSSAHSSQSFVLLVYSTVRFRLAAGLRGPAQ